MFITDYLYKIITSPIETTKLIVEIIILLLVLQFRIRSPPGIIKLSDEVVDILIEEFEPESLVDSPPPSVLLNELYKEDLLDLSNYDAFDLRNKFKGDLKSVIKEYGVGTCGPPTFYGTLDIHMQLEETVAAFMGTESALLYSNYYTCIQSVISCFCGLEDHVFYQKTASEGILRGLYFSKARSYEFTTIDSLATLMEVNFKPTVRNYVVVEGLSKNTGIVLPLHKLLLLKTRFKFRIILDEALSLPLLHKRGVVGFYNVDVREVEMIVGSFSCGIPSNGGFFAGSKAICEYQKISSSSYVFSASLPAVFAKFNILALNEELDSTLLQRNTLLFHNSFKSSRFVIVSSLCSPLVILTFKKELIEKTKEKDLLMCVYVVKHHLQANGIYLGVIKNPYPSLRVVLKASLEKNVILKISKMISKACEDFDWNKAI